MSKNKLELISLLPVESAEAEAEAVEHQAEIVVAVVLAQHLILILDLIEQQVVAKVSEKM